MMRKLCLLTLALALLIPVHVSAYTTFIVSDPTIADLTGIEFTDAGLPPAPMPWTSYGTSPISFANTTSGGTTVIGALDISSPLQFAIYNAGTGTYGVTWTSGPVSSDGVLFSYTEIGAGTPPGLAEVLLDSGFADPSLYSLDFTFDFSSFTVGDNPPTLDMGAVYTLSQVPVPSAVFLLAPGLLLLIGIRRRVNR